MSELARVAIPALFPNDESVYVTACYVVSGEAVEAGADIIAMEFSKAAVELEAPVSGFIRLLCEEQDEVMVGDTVAIIYETEAEASQVSASGALPQPASPSVPVLRNAIETATKAAAIDHAEASGINNTDAETVIAPVEDGAVPIFSREALRLVEERGLEVSLFTGSAFVRRIDVLAMLAQRDPSQVKVASSLPGVEDCKAPNPKKAVAKAPSTTVPFSSEKVSMGKSAEVRNLLNGQNLATSNFQKSIRTPGAPTGSGGAFGNLGSMPIVLRECCQLLKKHRCLNGFYHEGDICLYDEVNIGYAVDLGKGLQVVNLGDISEATDKEISVKIMTGVKAYMTGRLVPQEMAKVTFNVTDLSNESVEYFTPLLGKWQSASLGICSSDKATDTFKVSLTFDHRVTEGRLAAIFLRDLSAAVEAALNG